jgi:two-component system chemotaxis response regulator CheB
MEAANAPRSHDIPAVIAIGASAGGVEALKALMSTLPDDLRAAVVVVLHVAEAGTSVLTSILDRSCALPVTTGRHGEPLRPGHVFTARPGQHLLVEDGHLAVSEGPRENGHRPAVDPLFRSVAEALGPRSIGIVLSGTRDDGTAGLARIKARGGYAIVQDPEDALFDGMPRSAIAEVRVDAVLPIRDMAERLTLHTRALESGMPHITRDRTELPPATDGGATAYTCPDCGGALWRHDDGGVERYRCQVGHSYSLESFDVEQARALEAALWAAVRALQNRSTLLQEMAARASDRGHAHSARAWMRNAEESAERAHLVRELVEQSAPRDHDVVHDEPGTAS